MDIELRLSSHERRLSDFKLPIPTDDDVAQVEHLTCNHPALIREELDFCLDQLKSVIDDRVPTFTQEQLTIYETILNAPAMRKEPILLMNDESPIPIPM